MITPDQIPLLIKLQPKFKEMMGAWQVDDYWFHAKAKQKGYVKASEVAFMNSSGLNPDTLRIPLALDPECSGRCLWGMLEGYKSLNSGTPAILCVKRNGIADAIAYQSDNPYTALLKALIEQEGV
jgi:hypothetical protein